MLNLVTQFATHISPFMTVMSQVVAIWGFLNFINQLNLQNLTLVADRALGRLSGFKTAIFNLKNCDQNDIEESLEHVNEITKRLYMDLKQLGMANNYDMVYRIALLSPQNNFAEVRINYLKYELGSNWSNIHAANMIVPFIKKLEADLLNIFDLSHSGQTFVSHLLTNVIYISWFSFVIYIIELNNFAWAGYIFVVGVIVFVINYYMNK
jgi:hypothetical protein